MQVGRVQPAATMEGLEVYFRAARFGPSSSRCFWADWCRVHVGGI
jgi:hypothetical protein